MTPLTLTEAETDLKDAYLSGDAERIAAAESLVDKLDVPTGPPSLLGAALWYTEQGIPTFPLRVGGKKPWPGCGPCLTECAGPEVCGHPTCHGLKDATLDGDKIRWWWEQKPEANIGIATGHTFDVVDIDGPLGQASRVQHWAEVFEAIDQDAVAKVLTPRPGGMHIYVPPTGDGNSTGIVTGVDYRGKGGYVVAPPSVILPGDKDHPGTYRFLGTPALTTHVVRKAG